jgi:hypothetical protein
MPFFLNLGIAMKYLLLCLFFLISACAQLMKGAEQPVMQYRDANTFRTTCSGTVEHWGSCNDKANKTCSNGYVVVEKNADSNGVMRELIFSCKK